MEAAPKVSIIIPCFNRLDRTAECWPALQRSLGGGPASEVIFVDNASQDGTADFLEELKRSSGARLIRNRENLGFAKANNQGATHARGEFLVFLNNDTVPLAGWLDPLLRLLADDPAIGLVGSKLLYPDGRVQHAGVIVREKITGKNQLVCDHVYRLSLAEAPWVNVQREYQALTGACLAMGREIFQRLGGFDETYVNGYEDLDLCFRARAAGLKVVYCPSSVLVHHESSTQGRNAFDEQNTAHFFARWGDRIRADEDATYAAAARPNLSELRTELLALRVAFEKIQAAHPDMKSGERDGIFRRTILRWLGISKAFRTMNENLRAQRNTIVHLRRITESMAMLLDYYEMERASPPLPRADQSLH